MPRQGVSTAATDGELSVLTELIGKDEPISPFLTVLFLVPPGELSTGPATLLRLQLGNPSVNQTLLPKAKQVNPQKLA